MNPIKSILKEELERLEQLSKKYREEIKKLPLGSISEKRRKGNSYAYLAFRKKGKVHFEYLGNVNSDKVKAIKEKVNSRQKYEKLLRQVKENAKELKRLLRRNERKK